MTKYIDADKLEKYIADGLNNPNKKEAFGFDAIQILSEIHFMPTADVQEVRHGKWIPTRDIVGDVVYENCSVCGIQFRAETVAECGIFCPHCGARMDGNER